MVSNGIKEHLSNGDDIRSDNEGEPTIGYDFEDEQTRLQLKLIDDLRELNVSNVLDLPQLIVVGDQSTGKSSVLQAVTEVPFDTGDGMCTRFATEIVLERTAPNERAETKARIIPDVNDSSDRKKELKAWRPESFDKFAPLDKAIMKDLVEQADDMIFGRAPEKISFKNAKPPKILSTATLRITRSGPKETNFAIVDIPGLVRGDDKDPNKRKALELVMKYLKNPSSIVVVVIDIIDYNRQDISHILSNLPNAESRAIGVINKCDIKQPKSHEFVFDLIRNNKSKSDRYLVEGWYGLRNRAEAEKDTTDEERDKKENELFSGPVWNSLDQNKLGRHALKKALIRMRNQHIKQSIPRIISDIQSKLDACVREISNRGKPRATPHAQFTIMNQIATEYSERASGAIQGHYERLTNDKQFARKRVRDDLDKFQQKMNSGLYIKFTTSDDDAKLVSPCKSSDDWAATLLTHPTYTWVSSAIRTYRGKEEIGEVNPIVKTQLWRQQISSWEEISFDALARVEQTVEEVNASLFEKACPDAGLRLKLRTWLQDDFAKASENARIELQRLIESENDGHLFSLHPTMASRKQQFREARIQAILAECILKNPDAALPQASPTPLKVGSIAPNLVVQSILNNNPELVGVLNTHDSLAAYYEVALHRFIDNFALQVVERHLLGPRGPLRLFTSDYVIEKLYGEQNEAALNDLAGEDPKLAAERAKLEEERASLEESKKRVDGFKIL